MKIVVIDTETTGLDPAADRVVQVAAVDVSVNGGEIGSVSQSFVNPRRPIPSEASGIHHILDVDVADAPDLGEALDRVLTPMWPHTVDIVAAHNARFDRDFLPPLKDKRWIDTWRCALHLWPDAPSHGNSSLFYWLGFKRLATVAPHSAGFDVVVTAHIIQRLMTERSVEDLLKLSTKAVLLRKVRFGKHTGQLWTDVPIDYLQWGSRQTFDPDVSFTIRSELARRERGDQ